MMKFSDMARISLKIFFLQKSLEYSWNFNRNQWWKFMLIKWALIRSIRAHFENHWHDRSNIVSLPCALLAESIRATRLPTHVSEVLNILIQIIYVWKFSKKYFKLYQYNKIIIFDIFKLILFNGSFWINYLFVCYWINIICEFCNPIIVNRLKKLWIITEKRLKIN